MVGVLSRFVLNFCVTRTIYTSSLFSLESAVDVKSTSVGGADASTLSLLFLFDLLCLLRYLCSTADATWNLLVLRDSFTLDTTVRIGETDAVLFFPEYCLSKFSLF